MKNSESTYWLYAKNCKEEYLYRTQFPGLSGELSLPKVGKVQYRYAKEGGFPKIAPSNPQVKFSIYKEGDVMVRGAFQEVLSLKKYSWSQLGLVAMVSAAFFYFGLQLLISPKTATRSAKPKPVKIVAQLTVTPVPQFTPTPKVEATPLPVSTPQPKKPEQKKVQPVKKKTKVAPLPQKVSPQPFETKARQEFLKGDLSQAVYYISEAKAEGVPLTQGFLNLSSEVEYAICKRSMDKGEWENAVQHCGAAYKNQVDNQRVARLIASLGTRTRRLYLEGYAMEGLNTKAAIVRYKDAIRSATPNDPYGAKAVKKLKAIGVVS